MSEVRHFLFPIPLFESNSTTQSTLKTFNNNNTISYSHSHSHRRRNKQKRREEMEGSQVSQGHPYVPRDLHLPDYVPCFLSQSNILSVFAFFTLLLVFLIWIFSGQPFFFSFLITFIYFIHFKLNRKIQRCRVVIPIVRNKTVSSTSICVVE